MYNVHAHLRASIQPKFKKLYLTVYVWNIKKLLKNKYHSRNNKKNMFKENFTASKKLISRFSSSKFFLVYGWG